MKSILGRRFGPFVEIARAAWANKDNAGYAWRILNDGVCDGCALGTTGMRDWTMDETHLCWVRLNLLRLNTMGPMDPGLLAQVSGLRGRSERELRSLGRLPVPMVRRRGDQGFAPLPWSAAMDLLTRRFAEADPRRTAFYIVSRGTANETYYAAQKAARLLGTNHIDNSARICHSPSTVGLKQSVGFGATTCSYTDMLGTDWIILFGSDVANNQPVTMKYLHLAKKRGTRVAVVNPFREPGLDRYWVPSALDSAITGTQICDAFFQVRVGGDIAFIHGVLKELITRGACDDRFIEAHTEGFGALVEALGDTPWDRLELYSGTTRSEMARFADLYGAAGTAILVWSMGITMHRHGVDNVKAIANLALAKGNVGRPYTGLMPIRGHSGVQGGAEMGCAPNLFPGGEALSADSAARWSRTWGFEVPSEPGAFAADMVNMAHRGDLDALYCVGSNLADVFPDPAYGRAALEKVPFRVHHDIVVNKQMLFDPADTVLLLPATTRYEMEGGNTETSTERRVIFNPEIPGPRIPGARDEWRVLTELAARVKPEQARAVRFEGTAAIRREIARVVPDYDGIQNLARKGDQFQWGGSLLGQDGEFGLPGGKAKFWAVAVPENLTPQGMFRLSTRRGKQFNSMVFRDTDMSTGAGRDSVIMAREDLARLGVRAGQWVQVSSEAGAVRLKARAGDLKAGTVMLYWPEANAVIPGGNVDPESGMPGFRDTPVRVEKA